MLMHKTPLSAPILAPSPDSVNAKRIHLCIPMSQGKEYLQCSQPFMFLTVEASHNDDGMGRREQYDKDRPSESTLRNPYIRSTDSPRTR